MVVKVELGGGKTGAIEVRKEQNLHELALNFCSENALEVDNFADPLEKHLERKL